MNLEDFGFNAEQETYRRENNPGDFEIGRVTAEHKERYIVRTAEKELEAEITGNLRFTAKSREDFPAVGDWVALTVYDEDFAIIQQVLPRFSVLKRQTAGQTVDVQLIAANIDYALIMQSVDRDFNINRLERYLTICYAAKVNPVIVLSKTDLLPPEEVHGLQEKIRTRIGNAPVLAISSETHEGYAELLSFIRKGKTYCLLGSSGVGKSTLINHLSGKNIMETGSISTNTGKGRHITSHRELFVLENGGILIDNPGMREVGMADHASGLVAAFGTIARLADHCRYKDCTHVHEAGCSVIEAVEKGELNRASYENYLKLEREKTWFETSARERKRTEKIFGRIIKDYSKKDVKGKKF